LELFSACSEGAPEAGASAELPPQAARTAAVANSVSSRALRGKTDDDMNDPRQR
jgi:hypothetical protein